MKSITLLLTLFIAFYSYSQDQKGYYITTNGQRIEGFFNTTDFNDQRTLEFKDLSTAEYKALPTTNIAEYGIEDQFKFQQHTLQVDKSRSLGKNLSTKQKPEYEKQTLFLNVIVDGDASLYSATINQEVKYFYAIKSKNIAPTQLIYKKYSSTENLIMENNSYRQELFINLKCEGDNISSYNTITYTKEALKKVVENYNTCNGKSQVVYSNKGGKEVKVKYTVFAGPSMSTLRLDSDNGSDKSFKAGVAFGGELCIIMPSGKVAGFARLEYESVNNYVESGINRNRIKETFTLKGSFISLIFGPRFFITEKLFADAGLGVKTGIGDFTRENFTYVDSQPQSARREELDLNAGLFLNLGVGYNLTNAIGIDLRYDFNRTVLSGDTKVKTGRIGLNVRYTF
jgi:hypothetical protein